MLTTTNINPYDDDGTTTPPPQQHNNDDDGGVDVDGDGESTRHAADAL
jgi:hypothetical protein